jgi:hypothetical protein
MGSTAIGVDGHGRQHDLEGVRRKLLDHLLDRDDSTAGREDGLLLDARDAPDRHVPPAVRLLGVDDGDVRVEGRHGHQLLAGERAGYGRYRLRHPGQVRADVAAQDGERQVRGARDVAVRHPGVGVLLYL